MCIQGISLFFSRSHFTTFPGSCHSEEEKPPQWRHAMPLNTDATSTKHLTYILLPSTEKQPGPLSPTRQVSWSTICSWMGCKKMIMCNSGLTSYSSSDLHGLNVMCDLYRTSLRALKETDELLGWLNGPKRRFLTSQPVTRAWPRKVC